MTVASAAAASRTQQSSRKRCNKAMHWCIVAEVLKSTLPGGNARGSQPGVEFDEVIYATWRDVDEVIYAPSASRERGREEACRRRRHRRA